MAFRGADGKCQTTMAARTKHFAKMFSQLSMVEDRLGCSVYKGHDTYDNQTVKFDLSETDMCVGLCNHVPFHFDRLSLKRSFFTEDKSISSKWIAYSTAFGWIWIFVSGNFDCRELEWVTSVFIDDNDADMYNGAILDAINLPRRPGTDPDHSVQYAYLTPVYPRLCSECGKGQAQRLFHCKACRAKHVRVRYCSKSCQRAHWPLHRTVCFSASVA